MTPTAFCILFAAWMAVPVGFGVWRQTDCENFWAAPPEVIPINWIPRIFTALLSLTLATLIAAIWHVKGLDERIWIVPEMLATAVTWVLFFVPYSVLGFFIQYAVKNFRYPELFPLLIIVGSACSFVVSFGTPLALAMTRPQCLDFSGTPFDSMDSLLKDAEATRLLHEFLVKRACQEHLDFLIAVREYHEIRDPETLRSKFEEIRDEFFGEGEARVNVSGPKRLAIIVTHPGDADGTTFDPVATEVFTLLRGQHFATAMQYKPIREYLEEIATHDPRWLQGSQRDLRKQLSMGNLA
jgi:hypothetical protein